jgi:hypothetical protein
VRHFTGFIVPTDGNYGDDMAAQLYEQQPLPSWIGGHFTSP